MSTAERAVTISDWIRQRAAAGLPTSPPSPVLAQPTHGFGGFVAGGGLVHGYSPPSAPLAPWPEEL